MDNTKEIALQNCTTNHAAKVHCKVAVRNYIAKMHYNGTAK